MPNDEFALYGGGDFRLRVPDVGRLLPDGVTGLRPDEFEEFFRLRGRGPGGDTVVPGPGGVDYRLAGGTLRVVGLADLGRREAEYDDCYQEDRDNHIDIIPDGDEAAARASRRSRSRPTGRLPRLLQPRRTRAEPFPGVRYTAPGPPDVQPVTLAPGRPDAGDPGAGRERPAGRILGLAAATLAVVLAVAVYWRRGWTRPRPERPPAGTDRPPQHPGRVKISAATERTSSSVTASMRSITSSMLSSSSWTSSALPIRDIREAESSRPSTRPPRS